VILAVIGLVLTLLGVAGAGWAGARPTSENPWAPTGGYLGWT
jgi:hypothetical protein